MNYLSISIICYVTQIRGEIIPLYSYTGYQTWSRYTPAIIIKHVVYTQIIFKTCTRGKEKSFTCVSDLYKKKNLMSNGYYNMKVSIRLTSYPASPRTK